MPGDSQSQQGVKPKSAVKFWNCKKMETLLLCQVKGQHETNVGQVKNYAKCGHNIRNNGD